MQAPPHPGIEAGGQEVIRDNREFSDKFVLFEMLYTILFCSFLAFLFLKKKELPVAARDFIH
jgi:hypothetical protein